MIMICEEEKIVNINIERNSFFRKYIFQNFKYFRYKYICIELNTKEYPISKILD